MKFHTCKNCGEVLTSQLELRGGQLVLPCWECGAENIVQAFLEVVGLQLRDRASNGELSYKHLDV